MKKSRPERKLAKMRNLVSCKRNTSFFSGKQNCFIIYEEIVRILKRHAHHQWPLLSHFFLLAVISYGLFLYKEIKGTLLIFNDILKMNVAITKAQHGEADNLVVYMYWTF